MSPKGKGILRIGTSNIVLPGNKQSFPEAYRDKSRLSYYGSLFNTLEVNSSFYKIPMKSTFEKWSSVVPENFRFTLKLWREITHAKDLHFEINSISKFITAAKGIGSRKGCLLIQFPGKITLDYFKQLELILEAIQTHDPEKEWRLAIEFRNASWYAGETFELLKEYDATIVFHDHPKAKIFEPTKNAPFMYVRFHGLLGDYRGSYNKNFLKEKAALISSWLNDAKDVYVYFNNTIGNAFNNARELNSMIKI